MSIPKYHFYHGAALSLITVRGEFAGLARLPALGAGAYAVNHNIGLFIKHATAEQSPWHFTFTPAHQDAIRTMFNRFQERAFVVLVCGTDGVCVMEYGQYAAVIDENFTEQEQITVERRGRGGFRVRGAQGPLGRVMPVSRFPDCLFA